MKIKKGIQVLFEGGALRDCRKISVQMLRCPSRGKSRVPAELLSCEFIANRTTY